MLSKYRIEIIIVLVIHIGYMIYQLIAQHYILDDSAEYLATTNNLLSEGTLYNGDLNQHIDPALFTKRPPGYPLFLLISRLFTHHFAPVIILQLVLSMMSFFAMLKIFQPDGYARMMVTAFIVFYPAQFIYTNLVMAEILFQFILMMAALALFRYLKTERFRMLFVYELMIILGILVKPVLYPFVILNILLSLVLYYRYRQRLIIISSLIPLIFVIIYASINQQRTGYFHVSSIQQVNLVDYNLYFYLMDQQGEEVAGQVTEEIRSTCGKEPDFRKRSRCLSDAATSIFKENILHYGWFHLKGMGRFFIDPGRFDLYHFFGLESSRGRGFLYHINKSGIKGAWEYLHMQQTGIILMLLGIAFVNFVRAIGFLFFLFNRKIDVAFRLFLFFLVGYIAFATGPLGASRFMLPMVLLVTGAAAFQYGWWLNMLTRKKQVTAD
jgi:hypothetical protein